MKLIDKLKLIRDKASVYSNLKSNLDFGQWQEEIVEKRLMAYLKKVVTADLDDAVGREEALNNLRNYQQLSFVCKDIFDVWEFTETEAIKKINKLKENEDNPQPRS